MYPHRFEEDDNECNTLCADCYWDEDSRRKHRRRVYYAHHPEEYEAFRKQAAETLGVPYQPLPAEWYAAATEILEEEEKKEWSVADIAILAKEETPQSDSK